MDCNSDVSSSGVGFSKKASCIAGSSPEFLIAASEIFDNEFIILHSSTTDILVLFATGIPGIILFMFAILTCGAFLLIRVLAALVLILRILLSKSVPAF